MQNGCSGWGAIAVPAKFRREAQFVCHVAILNDIARHNAQALLRFSFGEVIGPYPLCTQSLATKTLMK